MRRLATPLKLGRLSMARVRGGTQLRYLRAIWRFLGARRMAALPPWTAHKWGDALAEFSEDLFDRFRPFGDAL